MNTIASKLQAKKSTHHASVKRHRLQALKTNLVGGIFAQKKRKEKEKKLRILLKHSIFLREDESRRRRWLAAIGSISLDLLDRLIPAIVREDLRYKQKKRNLVVELNKKHVNDNFG